MTEDPNIDLCDDETIYSIAFYGKAGTGVIGRVKNKPGVTKGGQTVLLSDVNSTTPCEYMHRHKMHRNPPCWTVMGNFEVKNLMEDLNPIIKREVRYRKIFKEHPHYTFNNYFSGVKIIDWLGREVFCVTFTFIRGRLPPDISAQHLHKKKPGMSDKKRFWVLSACCSTKKFEAKEQTITNNGRE